MKEVTQKECESILKSFLNDWLSTGKTQISFYRKIRNSLAVKGIDYSLVHIARFFNGDRSVPKNVQQILLECISKLCNELTTLNNNTK